VNGHLSIVSYLYSAVLLRTIGARDQTNLRAWKNENRQFFFYKEIISETAQQEWFRKYQTREHDYMFIVLANGLEIGCMGVRMLEATWDVYNVILGNTQFAKKGFMGQAFQLMCSFAITVSPMRISAQVLNSNPALSWYTHNAFQIVVNRTDHVEIELDQSRFVPCPITWLN